MATDTGTQVQAWRNRWGAGIGAAARRVLDLGLPPLCPTCREPVADPGEVCSQCWSKLSIHFATLLRAPGHSVCL